MCIYIPPLRGTPKKGTTMQTIGRLLNVQC